MTLPWKWWWMHWWSPWHQGSEDLLFQLNPWEYRLRLGDFVADGENAPGQVVDGKLAEVFCLELRLDALAGGWDDGFE